MILIEESRNLTAFITFLSLLRMIQLSQNAIILMIQFVQIIIEIFRKYIIVSRCGSFVDDINVKNSCSNYNEKEIFFQIRLFIMKYVQWLNVVFVNLKKIEYTISNEKFQFCMFELKIVNFVCDSKNKFFEIAKVRKILEQSSYCNVSKIRTFINVCVYYWIWIINFIIITSFIYHLLKNEKLFV